MIGAIAGDIIGSVYEFAPIKHTAFPLFSNQSHFTDDTVLTVAIADLLLHGGDIIDTLKKYWRDFPEQGYGRSFTRWAASESREPYHSWGNGSAMRTSPVGFFFTNEKDVLDAAKSYASVTHNHPHGIRGAQAVSLCIFMANQGATKNEIREQISRRFNYDLSHSIENIRPDYGFDVSCQGSVPQSIIAFLESTGVENAIRLAVSLGGDADTMACIAGGIAEAYYGYLPENIVREVRKRIPAQFRSVIDAFYASIEI